MTRSQSAVLGFVLAATAVPCSSARADPPSEYENRMELTLAFMDLEKAMKAGDEDAANAAICKVPPLYRALAGDAKASPNTTNAPASSFLKPLGEAVRQTKLPRVRPTALQALVDIEDPEVAWRGLKPAYPKNDVEDPTKFNVEIVKAVGTLHPEAAVDTLLLTFRWAKQVELSAEAALALGKYRKSKQRERILGEVVKIAKDLKPATDGKTAGTPEAQARWEALRIPVGKGLDALTGQTVGDAVEWFKKVDDAKGNLKGLFKD